MDRHPTGLDIRRWGCRLTPEITPAPPRAPLAIIGGAVTRALRFPEDLADPGVEVVSTGLVYQTPRGPTAPFKHLRLRTTDTHGGATVDALYLRYLGVRSGATRTADVEAAFQVMEAAGVRRIVTDDNMGSLNPLLDPGDVVVCHDFIDLHKEASVASLEGKLVRLRDPFCPSLTGLIHEHARGAEIGRVFRRGVYAVSHGTRFESPAEIAMYRHVGGDIVGYSLVPAVYLARAMGACYAGLYLVSNYGEGLVSSWEHDTVCQLSDAVPPAIGRILLNVTKQAPLPPDCQCGDYVSARPPSVVAYPDR
jgi:5'-methylthioadenosine phosphorylase